MPTFAKVSACRGWVLCQEVAGGTRPAPMAPLRAFTTGCSTDPFPRLGALPRALRPRMVRTCTSDTTLGAAPMQSRGVGAARSLAHAQGTVRLGPGVQQSRWKCRVPASSSWTGAGAGAGHQHWWLSRVHCSMSFSCAVANSPCSSPSSLPYFPVWTVYS